MIDVVIPLGKGSRWGDNELRYCLRAIEENLTNYRNIWIIGELPKWTTNVWHIPLKDNYSVPDYNIMLKIKAACEDKRISQDFLFMNDDHFLLHQFNAPNFPNYHDGTCNDILKLRSLSPYQKRVRATNDYLLSKHLPNRYFDIHYPIIYNKDKFLKRVVYAVNWPKSKGFVIKSLYANHEEEFEPIKDCKSQWVPWKDDKCYSTMPLLRPVVKEFFLKRFPNKSKYEV